MKPPEARDRAVEFPAASPCSESQGTESFSGAPLLRLPALEVGLC